MKFENTEVWGFDHALRGMRNPMNSWDKSDSVNCAQCSADTVDSCCYVKPYYQCYGSQNFIIGENDMKLSQKLIKAGSEHRKFMRQIFVSVDITAPLYWWKEFDTYKVGTVANSTSTMHKLTSQPITLDCFEIDDYDQELFFEERSSSVPDMPGLKYNVLLLSFVNSTIRNLEHLRKKYLETNDKRYWRELVRWLPESWLQTRTITMSYENIFNMIKQRSNHKLNEWSGRDNPNLPNFISWAKTLPYANELLFISQEEDN